MLTRSYYTMPDLQYFCTITSCLRSVPIVSSHSHSPFVCIWVLDLKACVMKSRLPNHFEIPLFLQSTPMVSIHFAFSIFFNSYSSPVFIAACHLVVIVAIRPCAALKIAMQATSAGWWCKGGHPVPGCHKSSQSLSKVSSIMCSPREQISASQHDSIQSLWPTPVIGQGIWTGAFWRQTSAVLSNWRQLWSIASVKLISNETWGAIVTSTWAKKRRRTCRQAW